jgi:signal transduction histidine kinase
VRSLVQVVGYVNLVLFTLLAIAALRQWRAGKGRAGLWAALTFAALALVVDLGQLLPEQSESTAAEVAMRALIGVLVLFPYLLYRFTTAFERPTRRLEQFVVLMTVVVLVWTFALPDIPDEGESWPVWFALYVVAFLVHWTVLSTVVAVRLWRAGRGQPSVAGRRMQLLSVAASALTLALLLSAFGSDEASPLALAVALLVTLSAVAFLLGLAPPAILRTIWRRPEQERLQDAITRLMGAMSEEEVADHVLPPVARLVGARAAGLEAADGRWIGAYLASDAMLAEVGRAADERSRDDVLRLPMPGGSLVVWTSSYAPYFGSDELRLLETLAALTGLALDRSRLFAHEREARVVLERADEVKTNFVALAAHELRTPVASIKGIVDTLHARGEQLREGQRDQLEVTLRQQTDRIGVLVEQLLDLSRLDAEAVPIRPQPLAVRQRVEELVSTAAGPRRADVRIDVPPDLAALVDPTAFDRIVSNLVVNALRYGEAPVVVTAERSDRHFRLAVEDRGPGVPPEFVPNLFERFSRSEQTRERAGGSGLGLAIARSYAQAHRGDLIYEHAEPRGARFNLVLPAE